MLPDVLLLKVMRRTLFAGSSKLMPPSALTVRLYEVTALPRVCVTGPPVEVMPTMPVPAAALIGPPTVMGPADVRLMLPAVVSAPRLSAPAPV